MNATWKHSPYFNTWDWQWTYTVFKCGGLAVMPGVNMISNIGYSGTHEVNSALCALPLQPLPADLKHPEQLETDPETDAWLFHHFYRGTWKDRVRFLLHGLTGKDWM